MMNYRIVPKPDGKFYAQWNLFEKWYPLKRINTWGQLVDDCRTEKEALELIEKDKENNRKEEERRKADAKFREENPIIYIT